MNPLALKSPLVWSDLGARHARFVLATCKCLRFGPLSCAAVRVWTLPLAFCACARCLVLCSLCNKTKPRTSNFLGTTIDFEVLKRFFFLVPSITTIQTIIKYEESILQQCGPRIEIKSLLVSDQSTGIFFLDGVRYIYIYTRDLSVCSRGKE